MTHVPLQAPGSWPSVARVRYVCVMWQIGDPLISNPLGDGVDFHLLFESQAPGASSFLYVPCTTDPGLALDSIRVDRIAPSSQALPAIVEDIRQRHVQFAAPRPLQLSLVDSSPADALFALALEGHPLIGSYQSWVRFRRTATADIAVQIIRKLILPDDDAARTRFLREHPPVDGGMVRVTYDPAALRTQESSAALEAIFQEVMRSRRLNLTTEELARHLARASSLLRPHEWWTLARMMGHRILEEGETDWFEPAVRYLELAILARNDLGIPPAADMFFDTVVTLAEILAYLPAGGTPEPLRRAGGLLEAAAGYWQSAGGADPGKARVAGILRVLVTAILEGCEQPASLLPERAEGWPDVPDGPEAAVDALMSYGARAVYAGHRGAPELYRRGAFAVDVAQVLWERGISRGRSLGPDEMGRLTVINSAQVRTQMLVHGVTQQDLDDTARLMPEVFGEERSNRMPLVFLRSLGTARRTMMDNRFRWRDRVPVPSTREALKRISIEAALHLALVRFFDSSSLGGPADLFGMQRGVLLKAKDDSGTAWRGYAELMIRYAGVIVVLYGESEGLVWELSEIVRQRACARMVLVIAPAQPDAPVATPAGQPLQRAGYVVSGATLEPGFLFFGPSGIFESRMDFESLWNGALASALLARISADPR